MRILTVALALTLLAAAVCGAGSPFAGRWDLMVTAPGRTSHPSWLEVIDKSGKLEARVQLRTGHAFKVYALKPDGANLLLTVSPARPARPAAEGRPAQGPRPETIWELSVKDGKLTGTQKAGRNVAQLAGVRAPALERAAPKVWETPIALFNGKDLTGWEPISNTFDSPAANYWTVENGELVNKGKGANLRTTRTFDDFKFHLEYLCPEGENSGIYLRGRYEAQVTAAPSSAPRPAQQGAAPPDPNPWPPRNPYGFAGCIYGFLGPKAPPPFRPGWQTYDITLIGRRVTVAFNGVTTINDQEIPGITGGAIDSHEGEPGPIYFQGDHHGGIRYRNITISLPKK